MEHGSERSVLPQPSFEANLTEWVEHSVEVVRGHGAKTLQIRQSGGS